MPDQESETRDCPFCKEEIKATALRCKHCLSDIPPTKPDHGGVCPLCREEINPEALRCPHCKADLAPTESESPLRERRLLRRLARRPETAPTAPGTRRVAPRRVDGPEPTILRERSSICDGCAETDVDSAGTWSLIECSEHFCIYELTEPNPYGVFR